LAEGILTDPPWQPFYAENLQVEWEAATNSLPATVAVFKVVPTWFSPTVISNVMRLAWATSLDRIRPPAGMEPPPRSVYFQSQDQKTNLIFVPFYGVIAVQAPDDLHAPFDFEKVPDEARAYELTTNILKELEIPIGEVPVREDQQPHITFAAGTFGTPWERHRDTMRAEFGRQLDHIDCDLPAFWIEFGAHERVWRLELSWPRVQVEKRYPMATGDQIIAWIKEGRARVISLGGCSDSGVVEPGKIQRLAIKGINLRYYSYSPMDIERKPANRVYPYAVLDAEAEFAQGDTEDFPLYCPIVPEGLPPVSHETRLFGVYRSKRSGKCGGCP
jgi:hypothetical protein